jgi:hypothetical protein
MVAGSLLSILAIATSMQFRVFVHPLQDTTSRCRVLTRSYFSILNFVNVY